MRFGDIVINGWASKSNPTRVGIFVRATKNAYECTDGVRFWKIIKTDAKVQVVGSIDMGAFEEMKKAQCDHKQIRKPQNRNDEEHTHAKNHGFFHGPGPVSVCDRARGGRSGCR